MIEIDSRIMCIWHEISYTRTEIFSVPLLHRRVYNLIDPCDSRDTVLPHPVDMTVCPLRTPAVWPVTSA
jgi:hypothetical protein